MGNNKRKVKNSKELTKVELVNMLIKQYAHNKDVKALEDLKEQIIEAKRIATCEMAMNLGITTLGGVSFLIGIRGDDVLAVTQSTLSMIILLTAVLPFLERAREVYGYKESMNKINRLTYSIKQ